MPTEHATLTDLDQYMEQVYEHGEEKIKGKRERESVCVCVCVCGWVCVMVVGYNIVYLIIMR